MDFKITNEQRMNLLRLARQTIASRLGHKDGDSIAINLDDEILREKYGVFVTIHINGSLRGCIGYIIGYIPLVDAIREMAISAAFKDPRFAPLSVSEYPLIDIEISVLSPIENVENINDIVVGRDGLIMRKGGASGLLLPQVATEYKWTLDQFLEHTCLKAGLPQGEWKKGLVEIQKFTAVVFNEKELGLLPH
jgi:AmmeMemoRadiSam system protein A